MSEVKNHNDACLVVDMTTVLKNLLESFGHEVEDFVSDTDSEAVSDSFAGQLFVRDVPKELLERQIRGAVNFHNSLQKKHYGSVIELSCEEQDHSIIINLVVFDTVVSTFILQQITEGVLVRILK